MLTKHSGCIIFQEQALCGWGAGGKWSVMVIHYLIRQRRRWSFSSDSFLEVPIYWPLREKTLMANPKQLFRGHLLQRRRDTLHKRTLQPPSLFKYNPQEDPHHKQRQPQPQSGRLPTQHTPVQSGNINNASTNEYITIQVKSLKAPKRYLSWELNSDTGAY